MKKILVTGLVINLAASVALAQVQNKKSSKATTSSVTAASVVAPAATNAAAPAGIIGEGTTSTTIEQIQTELPSKWSGGIYLSAAQGVTDATLSKIKTNGMYTETLVSVGYKLTDKIKVSGRVDFANTLNNEDKASDYANHFATKPAAYALILSGGTDGILGAETTILSGRIQYGVSGRNTLRGDVILPYTLPAGFTANLVLNPRLSVNSNYKELVNGTAVTRSGRNTSTMILGGGIGRELAKDLSFSQDLYYVANSDLENSLTYSESLMPETSLSYKANKNTTLAFVVMQDHASVDSKSASSNGAFELYKTSETKYQVRADLRF